MISTNQEHTFKNILPLQEGWKFGTVGVVVMLTLFASFLDVLTVALLQSTHANTIPEAIVSGLLMLLLLLMFGVVLSVGVARFYVAQKLLLAGYVGFLAFVLIFITEVIADYMADKMSSNFSFGPWTIVLLVTFVKIALPVGLLIVMLRQFKTWYSRNYQSAIVIACIVLVGLFGAMAFLRSAVDNSFQGGYNTIVKSVLFGDSAKPGRIYELPVPFWGYNQLRYDYDGGRGLAIYVITYENPEAPQFDGGWTPTVAVRSLHPPKEFNPPDNCAVQSITNHSFSAQPTRACEKIGKSKHGCDVYVSVDETHQTAFCKMSSLTLVAIDLYQPTPIADHELVALVDSLQQRDGVLPVME